MQLYSEKYSAIASLNETPTHEHCHQLTCLSVHIVQHREINSVLIHCFTCQIKNKRHFEKGKGKQVKTAECVNVSAAPDQRGGHPACAVSAQQTSVFCEVWSKSFEGLQKKIKLW